MGDFGHLAGWALIWVSVGTMFALMFHGFKVIEHHHHYDNENEDDEE